MNGIFRFLLILPVFMVLSTWSAKAQTPPTIVEFWTKADTLFLEVTLNAEMFLSGIDPETRPDFADDARYRELRRRVSSELEPEVRSFVKDWAASLKVELAGPVSLSYEGVRIPIVGDPDTPRLSKLLLATPLPEGASSLRLTWPEGHGPAVVKQQRVDAPYTGYLVAGEVSPLIPLQGGAALSPKQTLREYFPKGFLRVLPSGPQLVLLVLTLVAMSFHLRPVLSQLAFLTFGIVVGSTLGVFGVFYMSPQFAAQAILIAIVVLALWNLIRARLQVWRLLAVIFIGAVQGLGLANAMTKVGLPPEHKLPAILGYAAGVLVGLVAVALVVLGMVSLLSGRSHRMRDRISVLVSLTAASIGFFLSVEYILGF